MKIDEKTIEYVANLACLSLSQDEEKLFTKDLSRILEYVDKLSEIDTENIEPTNHILTIHNVLRKDEVIKFSDKKALLSNAPLAEENCFCVPKIIE